MKSTSALKKRRLKTWAPIYSGLFSLNLTNSKSAHTMKYMNEVTMLREMARNYREAADMLDNAADIIDRLAGKGLMNGAKQDYKPRKKRVARKTRAEAMKEMVHLKGPMTKKDFLDSGIASSTIHFILSDPANGFVQLENKRWTVQDESGPGQHTQGL